MYVFLSTCCVDFLTNFFVFEYIHHILDYCYNRPDNYLNFVNNSFNVADGDPPLGVCEGMCLDMQYRNMNGHFLQYPQ